MAAAKTLMGKTYWFVLIFVSIVMTAVSVSLAVKNFFAEKSHIVVEHTEFEDMLYPPLKVCFNNWADWVNYTAAQEKGFTKSEVLYAMSILTEIFSEKRFDVNEVEGSFFEKLKLNNMSLIEEFYESIALRRKNIMKNLKNESLEYKVVIENHRFDLSPETSFALCYEFSLKQVSVRIDKQLKFSGSQEAIFVILLGNLAATEREKTWLTYNEMYYFPFFRPILLILNGFTRTSEYLVGNESKYVLMKPTVRYWQNTQENPCYEDRNWVEGNMTCFEKCNEKFFPELKESKLKRIYTKKVFTSEDYTGIYSYFGNPGDMTKINKISINNSIFIHSNEMSLSPPHEKKEPLHLYDECIKNCKLEAGCRVWSYTRIFENMPQFENRHILLVYPTSVEVMKEVHLQTWKNFVSSIGGLLCIWTGASVLTFLQVVYTCSAVRDV